MHACACACKRRCALHCGFLRGLQLLSTPLRDPPPELLDLMYQPTAAPRGRPVELTVVVAAGGNAHRVQRSLYYARVLLIIRKLTVELGTQEYYYSNYLSSSVVVASGSRRRALDCGLSSGSSHACMLACLRACVLAGSDGREDLDSVEVRSPGADVAAALYARAVEQPRSRRHPCLFPAKLYGLTTSASGLGSPLPRLHDELEFGKVSSRGWCGQAYIIEYGRWDLIAPLQMRRRGLGLVVLEAKARGMQHTTWHAASTVLCWLLSLLLVSIIS